MKHVRTLNREFNGSRQNNALGTTCGFWTSGRRPDHTSCKMSVTVGGNMNSEKNPNTVQ